MDRDTSPDETELETGRGRKPPAASPTLTHHGGGALAVPAAMPPRIGRHVIERELGRGGMGVVYLAQDPRLSRRVAIKVLNRQLAAQPGFRARFEREARLLAAVSHPHVVTIHELEEADGELLFVVEHLEGAGLDELLRKGPLGIQETLRVGLGVAAALEAAHLQNVLHRDLKPANIKATASGTWKVLDFGLARPIEQSGDVSLTTAGTVLGTPGYMSPEQLRGQELDAATDTWALGCVLYECLTGRRAFEGASFAERAAAILAGEPDWSAVPAGTPSSFVMLLKRLLDRNRGTRLGKAAQVRAELEALTATALPLETARPFAKIPHSLPAERDAFVGRTQELRDLAARLAGGQRLVTVVGMAGTGKTRLVQRHAWERMDDWPGGVFFCDLSEAWSLDGIASAVAGALDVPLGKDEASVQLGHAIAGRGRCLLLLDNFEQVTAHAQATVGTWLERAKDASFVVTSREVLSIPGEHVLTLHPLPPEGAGLELFVARARARHEGFAITESGERTVREVVTLLDGLPLAIELAAARIRTLSPDQLLVRLRDRFSVLVGARGAEARQSTLRAAIDWSWALLEPWEQAALAQASVFAGGFTLEAAESVLDLSAWPQAPPAMDVVQSLVDKSLFRTWLPGEDRRHADLAPYFAMYASIHEYAAEKLRSQGALDAGASGAAAEAAAHARHGRHYARLGSEEALDALDSQGGVARRRALALDIENLVAACRRAAARGDGATSVATLDAAWRVLESSGPFLLAADLGRELLVLGSLERSERGRVARIVADALRSAGRMEEALQLCQEALALAREGGARRSEGVALGSLAALRMIQGRSDEALRLFGESLAIHREVGNRRAEGIVLGGLGNLLSEQGRMDEALQHYEQAVAIHRETGSRHAEGVVLGNMGSLQYERGLMDEALRHQRAALAIHREGGNRRLEGIVLGNLGNLHQREGRAEEALACFEQALAIHREVGDRRSEGYVLGSLGNRHADQGRMDEALALYRDALAISREVGSRASEANVLGALGLLHQARGRLDEARRHHEEALALHREAGSRRLEGIVLGNLGNVHLELGRAGEALRLYQEALAIARETRDVRSEGHLLGSLGSLHACEGRFGEAREALAAGEELLRGHGFRLDQAKVSCLRSDCERRAGDIAASRRHLADAESVARELGIGKESELGREIARLRAALEAPESA